LAKYLHGPLVIQSNFVHPLPFCLSTSLEMTPCVVEGVFPRFEGRVSFWNRHFVLSSNKVYCSTEYSLLPLQCCIRHLPLASFFMSISCARHLLSTVLVIALLPCLPYLRLLITAVYRNEG